ncbi:unnamed protein product, partial [Aureobasidium mustum]
AWLRILRFQVRDGCLQKRAYYDRISGRWSLLRMSTTHFNLSNLSSQASQFVAMSKFPICCAIAPTAELNYNYEGNGNDDSFLVFVDDVSRVYGVEDEDPNVDTDSTSAPFAEKSAYECWLMLKDMLEKNDANCFSDDIFAVLDERSLEDGTLLLVEEPEEEDGGEASSVRAMFEMCETQMLLWVAGKNTVYEANERVKQTEDGVLRPGMDIGDS